MLAAITDQINTFKSSPNKKDSSKPPDPTTVVLANSIYPSLGGGKSMKIGGMWNLKHDISSQNFYELLINIKLKE